MSGWASSWGSGSKSDSREAKREAEEGEGKAAIVPQTSQAAAAAGLEKVQARHDHRKTSPVTEDDEEEGMGMGERQIWQEDFWEGGLTKVHLLQVQEQEEEKDEEEEEAILCST